MKRVIALLLLLTLFLTGCEMTVSMQQPAAIPENSEGLTVHFIDVGQAGVGDRHIDLYWAIWSLQYNLGTDAYTDLFLDLYGRGKVDEELLRVVAEVEASYDDK